MAILFRCNCGKVMQAKEENAGARCKCLSCGAVLQIPAPPTLVSFARPAAPSAAAAPAPATPETISLAPPAPPAAAATTAPTPPSAPVSGPSAANPTSPIAIDRVDTLPYPPPPTPSQPPPPPVFLPNPRYHGMPPAPPPTIGWPSPTGVKPGYPGSRSRSNDADTWFLSDPRIRRRRRRALAFSLVAIGIFLLVGLAAGAWLLIANQGDRPADLQGQAGNRDKTDDVSRDKSKDSPAKDGSKESPIKDSSVKDGGPVKDKKVDPPPPLDMTELDRFALVPRDAALFFSVRVSDLWGSKTFKAARADYGLKIDEVMGSGLGLKMADWERLTFVLAEVPPGDGLMGPEPPFWFLLHSRIPFNRDRIRFGVMPGGMERTAGGKTYYVDRNMDMALYMPTSKEIVFGKPDTVSQIAAGTRRISMEGPQKSAILLAAGKKHHVVASLHMADALRTELQKMPADFPAMAKSLLDVSGATLTFDGNGGDLVATFKFNKVDSAREASKILFVAFGGFREELKALRFGPDVRLLTLADKALAGLKVDDRGDEVTVTLPDAGDILGPLLTEGMPFMERSFRDFAPPLPGPEPIPPPRP